MDGFCNKKEVTPFQSVKANGDLITQSVNNSEIPEDNIPLNAVSDSVIPRNLLTDRQAGRQQQFGDPGSLAQPAGLSSNPPEHSAPSPGAYSDSPLSLWEKKERKKANRLQALSWDSTTLLLLLP